MPKGIPHIPGEPCPYGHPYNRNKRGCRRCQQIKKKKSGKKVRPPIWMREQQVEFIWNARRTLRKRCHVGERPSNEELVNLWNAQDQRCAITHLPIIGTPALDHKVPVSAGCSGHRKWPTQLSGRTPLRRLSIGSWHPQMQYEISTR